MDADQDYIKWSYGRQIIKKQKDSADMQVYFDTYNKKYLVFDVEMTNWGSQAVLLSPENIYLKCAEGEGTRNAMNPELELLNKDIDQSRHEATAKNLAVAVGVVAVVGVVAAIATDTGVSSEGSSENNVANNIVNVTYVSTYVPPPQPAPTLPPSVDFWANYSLRKTTLEQGYKVGGKVVLPRMDYCPHLELYLPLGNETFVASFIQQIIQP